MTHYEAYSVKTNYDVLASCIVDILSLIKPAEEDRLKRQTTVNQLASLLRSMPNLTNATVKPFGSFLSNLYSKWGDLDISIELSSGLNASTRINVKRNLLCSIRRALQRTALGHDFQYIPLARVPVLKFQSSLNISCDISIDNYMGKIKSRFLLWINQMDGRFRDLVLLEWAKAHHINDPKSGTLNSYSLCLMVIFHLQTCQPAILPPLREIYEGNIGSDDTESVIMITDNYIEQRCAAAISRFKTKNKAPLSELLISFFEKFSKIGSRATVHAICTYTAQWEFIWTKPQWMEKSYALIIEDPFEQSDNAARAVGSRELAIISNAFKETHQKLSLSAVMSNRFSLLECLVRPNVSSQLVLRREHANPRTATQSPSSSSGASFSSRFSHTSLVNEDAPIIAPRIRITPIRRYPDEHATPIRTSDSPSSSSGASLSSRFSQASLYEDAPRNAPRIRISPIRRYPDEHATAMRTSDDPLSSSGASFSSRFSHASLLNEDAPRISPSIRITPIRRYPDDHATVIRTSDTGAAEMHTQSIWKPRSTDL